MLPWAASSCAASAIDPILKRTLSPRDINSPISVIDRRIESRQAVIRERFFEVSIWTTTERHASHDADAGAGRDPKGIGNMGSAGSSSARRPSRIRP